MRTHTALAPQAIRQLARALLYYEIQEQDQLSSELSRPLGVDADYVLCLPESPEASHHSDSTIRENTDVTRSPVATKDIRLNA
jgi:hypothetical protein